MKHMRLWSFCFVLLVLTSTANAEICDIRSAPRTELAGRSFYMELPGGRAVLVIGEATMNKEEHEQAVRLLAQAPQGTEELNKQVSQFLQERRQVVESAQIDFAILQQSLQQRAFNYLALESAPDALAKWTDKANDLYMDEAVRVRFGGLNKADGDRLLLITLGPALFLKADQSKLFTDVALMGIDLTLEPGPPPHRSRNVRAIPRLHEGNGRDQRNRRLADPDRMHYRALMLLAQRFADRNDVLDVIVKVEPAARKRKRPGIHPVGDVDVIEGMERSCWSSVEKRA
jgi:hypothetical protein